MTNVADAIVSDQPDSFAWSVWNKRHPVLIKQIQGAFPYPAEARENLDALLAETISGTIQRLPADAHDYALWEEWDRGWYGGSWLSAPFLWAESFFYRRLLEAVGYFRPGVWRGIDLFGPAKRGELGTSAVEAELAALDDVAGLGPVGQRRALLLAALWGNRADLGFRITAATEGPATDLVADDSALIWSILDAAEDPVVHLVTDNSGREFLADLILVDHLLATGAAARVVMHVKPQPYYVSDATGADVLDVLRRITLAPGAAAKTGQRLWAALADGTISLRTHAFWCAPLSFRHLPADLAADLARATLTVVKGDLNYRRLVGDRAWPPTTQFAELTAYFPSPVAALRTLKSDVAVGLTSQTVARLDANANADATGTGTGTRTAWRTSGEYALIQVRP
ncbi:damage-control phosphatase ARMT1 family protein [Catenulispora pinisilvae]|uniref:damage-control phosphatase ARMT1 family protein n=1 Tax=Catenulispora pinisilvae TaxID=2705253 RepID=UPI0018925783|nr:damage-control phosphatase ARMT1 family protein [Catenulispora pinisilvae]